MKSSLVRLCIDTRWCIDIRLRQSVDTDGNDPIRLCHIARAKKCAVNETNGTSNDKAHNLDPTSTPYAVGVKSLSFLLSLYVYVFQFNNFNFNLIIQNS